MEPDDDSVIVEGASAIVEGACTAESYRD